MANGYETGRPTVDRPSGIRTRDDFGDYVERVLGDFREEGEREWENNTLDRFLDGLSAFAWRVLTTSRPRRLRPGSCSPRLCMPPPDTNSTNSLSLSACLGARRTPPWRGCELPAQPFSGSHDAYPLRCSRLREGPEDFERPRRTLCPARITAIASTARRQRDSCLNVRICRVPAAGP
jgi:hypothetical protein